MLPAPAELIARALRAKKAVMRRPDQPLSRDGHLQREAFVYVRQSSDFRVRDHFERQRMQYARADHTRALGF